MTDGPKSLDDLRAEIDQIDRAMHDLLMQRAGLVGDLAAAKGEAPSLRPAREMEVLRSLAARHDGDMPFAVVLNIWREIMAASLSLQMPLKVVITGGEDALAYWDLARFHFGATTPFHLEASAHAVVHEVADAPGVIGVVPSVLFEEDAPWWTLLVGASEGGPRVAAKLPLLAGGGSIEGFMLARVEQRPTGDDVTLIAGLGDTDLGRSALASFLKDENITSKLIAVATDKNADRRYFLLQTDEFVSESDDRLSAIAKRDGVFQLNVIGGYARPISQPDAS